MKDLGVKGYAIVAAALVVGLAATGGFATAAMSGEGGTYDTYGMVDHSPPVHEYDTDRAAVSAVSFCNLDGSPPAVGGEGISFDSQTVDGVTGEWSVSYAPGNAQMDYVLLHGSDDSGAGYVVKIDNPTSPVSVHDRSASVLDDPTFGQDGACLGNDVGVTFENHDDGPA
jgi:hypothetical protein